jgi:hypothetical protein
MTQSKVNKRKLIKDTGGGCSVCGGLPVTNVVGTYWLCVPCLKMRDSDIAYDNLRLEGYYSEYDKRLVEEAERYGKPREENT